MSLTTTRSGDIGQNFEQVTIGETPNSVEISTNSKGAAQITVKLYYQTPDDLRRGASVQLGAILDELKNTLRAQGIPLAGGWEG